MTMDKEMQEMTALDIMFIIRELRKALEGGIVRKIFQYGGGRARQFLFEVYQPQKGAYWLYVDSGKVFLTRHKQATPQEPPGFCMFLRKHLMNRKVRSVVQHGFDRIVELATDENILVIELFSTGNLILCDSSYSIIMPLEFQKWKTREIKPKVIYRHPPRPVNPLGMAFDDLRRGLASTDKKLGAYLAASLGLGPAYSAEACARAGIAQDRPGKELSLDEASRLHQALMSMGSEKLSPSVYPGIVSPFPLKSMKAEPGSAPSLSDAFDEFFKEQKIEVAKEEVRQEVEQEKGKVERIMEQQDKAREKWERMMKESKDAGDLIYGNYDVVKAALEGIMKAKSSGMKWDEIKQAIANEGTPEAEAVKEIREGDAIVVLELGGRDIEIEFNRSVEENAARYYEEVKWARGKLGGLGEAMEESGKRLEEAETMGEKTLSEDIKKALFSREMPRKEEPKEPREERKRWYEGFRWFFSSDGFLVVAGKSAEQNEVLIKKHTDPRDLVFHADIQGAAFTVIKTQGLEVPELTRREAAEFAAANSKAWSRGLGTVDIFSVTGDRVTKSPPSGEYLTKGSFVIKGERMWYRNLELKMALGVKLDREAGRARVVAGPVMAVRKNSDYFVTLKPGFKKSMELAHAIRNKLLVKARPEDRFLLESLPYQDLQNAVPSGMADIVEHAGEAV